MENATTSSRPALRPALRLTLAMGLAWVLPVATTGCKSTEMWSDGKRAANAPPRPDQAPVHIGGGTPKTDFHSKVNPDQKFNVHVEMARVFETQGQYEAAIAEYQKAVEAAGAHGRVFGNGIASDQQALAQRRMANALGRMGRFAQAEVHYREALKLAPKDAKIWNDTGYCYYLQGRYADAERTLKMAEKFDPNEGRILTNLGLTQAATGRYDEALASLTRAGGPAAGHANLGYLLASQGRNDLAREHYAQALSIQPELGVVKQALAKLDRQGPTLPPAVQIAATAPRPARAAGADPSLRRVSAPSPTYPAVPGAFTTAASAPTRTTAVAATRPYVPAVSSLPAPRPYPSPSSLMPPKPSATTSRLNPLKPYAAPVASAPAPTSAALAPLPSPPPIP